MFKATFLGRNMDNPTQKIYRRSTNSWIPHLNEISIGLGRLGLNIV